MTNPVWLLGLDPVGGVLWLLLASNALPAGKSAMVPQVIVLLRWLSLARHLEPKAYRRVDKAATQGPRTALTRRGYTLKVDSRTSLITARMYWPGAVDLSTWRGICCGPRGGSRKTIRPSVRLKALLCHGVIFVLMASGYLGVTVTIILV